ncbi:DUF4062 domain-containing protein [Aeromonas caviae]|uniref:DUF4062 domain-containing protein n=1 Tax=Aeromonas caviae TaxID=648 RepID=UPI001432CC93|nr:DUF4062 domain-containing protein [Aeromonas caviae]NKD16894.1 DUF4062 domain-containing protein [Aeromonas caviae]
MNKKFQIFISSTYQDLKDEREQVIKAVLEMGHIPVGMEMFSAADEEQWRIITRQIDESDYYILLVAHRYGSTDQDGISYTEKEYDYAVSKSTPALAFVINDEAAWPKNKHESTESGREKLTWFKEKVKKRLVQFWSNKEELHGKCSISLMKAITAYPRAGWARADEVNGPEVMRELTRLSSENALLRAEVDSMRAKIESEGNEVRKTIIILSNNKRAFGVRKEEKWETAIRNEHSLASVFQYCAPYLLNENTSEGISENMALGAVGAGKYFRSWPVGSNVVSEVIADFSALGLVEPSKRKHPVADKTEYWSLTKFGKQVLGQLRKVRLEEGLPSDISQLSENG